jgi:hypothetical protein
VLILTHDRCVVCAARTIGSEIILNAPDGSPRRVGDVESHSVRLEIVLVSVQYRCTVCTNVPLAQKLFSTHPMILLGDKARVEACLSPFGDSANLDVR